MLAKGIHFIYNKWLNILYLLPTREEFWVINTLNSIYSTRSNPFCASRCRAITDLDQTSRWRFSHLNRETCILKCSRGSNTYSDLGLVGGVHGCRCYIHAWDINCLHGNWERCAHLIVHPFGLGCIDCNIHCGCWCPHLLRGGNFC
jgi:hypothetical protein